MAERRKNGHIHKAVMHCYRHYPYAHGRPIDDLCSRLARCAFDWPRKALTQMLCRLVETLHFVCAFHRS